MTNTEWNMAIEWLQGENGNWVEEGNKTIVAENLCGGRMYFMFENDILIKQSWSLIVAMCWLRD